MSYKFYSGLSGKTAIIFLLAFVSVALPVNLIVYRKVKSILTTADTEQLRTETEKLASLTKLDPIIVPLPASGYNVNVSEFRDGIIEPIFVSPAFPVQLTDWIPFETLELDTVKLFFIRKEQPDGSELWFTLARRNASIKNQIEEIKAYLFYITGGAFLLMVMLVILISNYMFNPLKRLVESAKLVHASEKMQRLPVPTSRDETKQLALALNDMIARIESTINYQIKFFESATHELKTPLSIMRAELSKAKIGTTNKQTQQWISNLQDEAEMLERSIADFLLMSQLKSRTLPLRKQSAQLPDLVFDVMQKLKRLSDERSVTFSVQQEPGEKTISVDTDKIQIVIINLVENSIRYCPEHGRIDISFKYTGSEVLLEISNAITSPILNIEKLGHNRYVDSQRGMGLGLWISSQLVELHKGKLSFICTSNTFTAELRLVGL